MTRTIRSWPFTTFGALTLALFIGAEWLHHARITGTVVEVLDAVIRLTILPLWGMRYVVVVIGRPLFAGPEGFPLWFELATLPVLLFPWIALDLLIVRRRRWRPTTIDS